MRSVLLSVGAALGAVLPAAAEKPTPRKDCYGDPLPPGAVARLGTVRLRHSDSVSSVFFSRDGRALITCGEFDAVTTPTATAAVCVWDAATGRLLRRFAEPRKNTRYYALAPEGDTLAVRGRAYGTIDLWQVSTGKLLRGLAVSSKNGLTGAMAFSPDGKALAVCRAADVLLWGVRGDARLRRFGGRVKGFRSPAFSADGKTLAAAEKKGHTVRLWDTATGERRYRVEAGKNAVALFSPDGRLLLTGGADGIVRVWESASGKRLRQWRVSAPLDEGGPLALSPDGKLLAASDDGHTFRLWDVASGKAVWEGAGLQHWLGALAFSPDGKTLASGGDDGSAALWDVATGRERPALGGHRRAVSSVAYSPDGRTLLSAGWDGTARVWDLATNREVRRLCQQPGEELFALALSPDGKAVAVGGMPGDIRLLETATGKELRRLKGHRSSLRSLAFSPDGRVLASSDQDREVRLWSAETGRELRRLGKGAGIRNGTALTLAFSPDGRALAVGGPFNSVNLWDVTGGRLQREFRVDEARVSAVTFSPDGTTLAAGTLDLADGGGPNAVYLWRVADGEPLRRLGSKGQEEWFVRGVAFSPDGRLLAYSDIGNQVHLYEVATGYEVGRFRGHTDEVQAIAFSPTGRTLASASRDTTILVWDVVGLTPGAGLPTRPLSAGRLGRLWEALNGRDGRAAFRAVGELVHADAAPFIAGRLGPVVAIPPERIASWVADLDSSDFATRQKASAELARAGEQAAPALRKALTVRPSPELNRRAKELLAKVQGQEQSPARLHEGRALMALELMGTPAAREVLCTLAAGAPEVWLTREANAALRRLTKRHSEEKSPKATPAAPPRRGKSPRP
jgi:WD40 repeat protein